MASVDDKAATLGPNVGPLVIGSWYYNKETDERYYTETPVFDTIEEAEAYLRGQDNGPVA